MKSKNNPKSEDERQEMNSTNVWLQKIKRREIRDKVKDALEHRMGIGKVGNWQKLRAGVKRGN